LLHVAHLPVYCAVEIVIHFVQEPILLNEFLRFLLEIMLITDLTPSRAKKSVIFNLKFCQNFATRIAQWIGGGG